MPMRNCRGATRSCRSRNWSCGTQQRALQARPSKHASWAGMADASGRIIVFNARFAQLFELERNVQAGTTLRILIRREPGAGRGRGPAPDLRRTAGSDPGASIGFVHP